MSWWLDKSRGGAICVCFAHWYAQSHAPKVHPFRKSLISLNLGIQELNKDKI